MRRLISSFSGAVFLAIVAVSGVAGQQAREVRVLTSGSVPGQKVSVALEIAATGNENAVGFSLNFDPRVLANPVVAIGSGLNGGTMHLNMASAAAGRVGVVIALSANQTFPSGAYQLLTVTFDVASNASSAASQISFGDQPVAREMVDTTASRLNTTFTSGAVKVVTHVQPPGILINPTPATSDDTIVVDVAGIWNDGCVPSNPDVTRNGSVIVLRTRHQGDYCSQAITTYRMNRTIGTLPPGTYSLVLIHDNMPSIGGSLQFGSSSFSVQARLVNANASSYNSESIAPQSIVVMFGQDLATTTITASAQQPPTSLGGTSVRIRDAVGVERLAPLFFVSATQVNYLVPAETAKGRATITLTNANGRVSVGTAMITSIAPGIFSIDGTGRGLVAGYVQRHTPSGEVRIEPIWRPGNAAELLPQPIDLGPPTDQVYLVIFGTGFRSRSSMSGVRVNVGGLPSEVRYAGEAGSDKGLDQCNITLDRRLIGRGSVELEMIVDGKSANLTTVSIK